MTPPAKIRLDDQLCFALYAASRAMTARYRPILSELGLTYPQYLVLMVLWEHGTASVRELSDRLGMDYGTLSPIVKRLERDGLVERSRRAEDERVVDVSLTAAGSALERSACDSMGMVDWSARELKALRSQLNELRASLDAQSDASFA